MSNEITFNKLYEIAKSIHHPRKLSAFIEAGAVSAVILTVDNNVYTGVCIDTSCSLGMCAERNAIANMITNGEQYIAKLACYTGNETVGSPCGACREYLMQLDKNSGNIQILTDFNTMSTVTLRKLLPDWWGTRFEDRI